MKRYRAEIKFEFFTRSELLIRISGENLREPLGSFRESLPLHEVDGVHVPDTSKISCKADNPSLREEYRKAIEKLVGLPYVQRFIKNNLEQGSPQAETSVSAFEHGYSTTTSRHPRQCGRNGEIHQTILRRTSGYRED